MERPSQARINSAADMSAKWRNNGRDRTAKRTRRKAVDGRTRAARAWARYFQDFMSRSGGRHEVLCKQLASLILQRERLDAALVRGEVVDPLHLVRLSGTINRTMTKLGLLEADDAPDATAQAIAFLRNHTDAEAER